MCVKENNLHFEGRFINDGKRAGKKVNVRFAAGYRTNTCSTTNFQWIRIFALRDIEAGEELYLDYGDDFWLHTAKPTQVPLSQPGSPSPPPNDPPVLPQTPSNQLNMQSMTTLSPIRQTSTRLQRTPTMSGIFLLQPPSPWAPTKSPPRILGHHNPHTSPTHHVYTHSQHTQTTQDPFTHPHTLILNDSLTLNDHPHTPTPTHGPTPQPHTPTPTLVLPERRPPPSTTTLSPIHRVPRRHQRTPPLSGMLLLQPPSPWEPTTTPPIIFGHHNPHLDPRHIPPTYTLNGHTHTHTLILNDTLAVNDSPPL